LENTKLSEMLERFGVHLKKKRVNEIDFGKVRNREYAVTKFRDTENMKNKRKSIWGVANARA
jgi:hypothetical protein